MTWVFPWKMPGEFPVRYFLIFFSRFPEDKPASSQGCPIFPWFFLWFSYGFPKTFLWFSYGIPMVFPFSHRFSHGFASLRSSSPRTWRSSDLRSGGLGISTLVTISWSNGPRGRGDEKEMMLICYRCYTYIYIYICSIYVRCSMTSYDMFLYHTNDIICYMFYLYIYICII